MLDLHQGFSGHETRGLPPTIASVALAELDVLSSLSRRRFRQAFRQQWAAIGLLAEMGRKTIRKAR